MMICSEVSEETLVFGILHNAKKNVKDYGKFWHVNKYILQDGITMSL